MRFQLAVLATLASFAAADTAFSVLRRQDWNGTSTINVNVNVNINIRIVLECPAGAPALSTTLFSVLYCPAATMFASFGYTYKVTAAGYLTITCPYTIEAGCATTVSHCECAVATAQTTAITFTKNNAISITQVECPTATHSIEVTAAGTVSTYTYYSKQETTIICEECQGQTVVQVGQVNSSRQAQVTPAIAHTVGTRMSVSAERTASSDHHPAAPEHKPAQAPSASPTWAKVSQVAGVQGEPGSSHGHAINAPHLVSNPSVPGNAVHGAGNLAQLDSSGSRSTQPAVLPQVSRASTFAASAILFVFAFTLAL